MPTVKNGEDANGLSRIVDAARKEQERREKTYREKALKIYPWICGRCGREFSGKRLRELTVHHRDHNHDNNPPDGSNWELLCLYCHDNEHARQQVAESYGTSDREDASASSTINQPFAALDALLKKMK
jgi:hypothetical protein